MIVAIYPHFIALFGIILYMFKPRWIIIYWLITFPIIFPLVNLALMIFDREIFITMMKSTYSGLRNMFFILVLIELYKRKFSFPKLDRVYIGICIVVFYILFHNVIHYINHITVFIKTLEIVSLVLPLLFLVMRRDLCPSARTLYKVFSLIIVVQILGLAANISGYHVYPTFYIPYIAENKNGSIYDDTVYAGGNMGVFPSAPMMANLFATIYLFIALEYFSGKRFSRKIFLFLTIIFGGIIVASGIRISLFLFVFAILFSNLLYIKKHVLSFVTLASFAIIGYVFLLSFDITSSNLSEETGIKRSIEGAANFVQSKKNKDDDSSTFRLTTYLLENYFLDGMIIGNGREDRGDFAYGNMGNMTLENFMSDAKLAYIFVEYGILGFAAYFIFFNSIISYMRKRVIPDDKRKLTLCFVFYAIMAIVDMGLFDRLQFPMLYLYFFSCLFPSPYYHKTKYPKIMTYNS